MDEERRLRSRDWFDNRERWDQTALYLERFMNYGVTPEELRSGKPIIGIAQSGSDLSPCNRIHLDLATRVRDGIRDAGGIPIEFPVHPIFENCRRPTAALDRNLLYLGLVELLASELRGGRSGKSSKPPHVTLGYTLVRRQSDAAPGLARGAFRGTRTDG